MLGLRQDIIIDLTDTINNVNILHAPIRFLKLTTINGNNSGKQTLLTNLILYRL